MYLRAFRKHLLKTNRVDLFPRDLLVVLDHPSVKTFPIMSNLNFFWSSCKPFPHILSDTRKRRSAHPSTLPFWGSCRQPWGHPSIYSSLSWTDQIYSAILHKSCPLVFSPYSSPSFGHVLMLKHPSYTVETQTVHSTSGEAASMLRIVGQPLLYLAGSSELNGSQDSKKSETDLCPKRDVTWYH